MKMINKTVNGAANRAGKQAGYWAVDGAVRGCDDGSIELRALGECWRAVVYLEPEEEDSGWVLICRGKTGPPEMEIGTLGEMDKLGLLLSKQGGAVPS